MEGSERVVEVVTSAVGGALFVVSVVVKEATLQTRKDLC